MPIHSPENSRPPYDQELLAITDYVINTPINSPLAYSTARYCLLDALGCAILALQYPSCTALLGPLVSDTVVPQGTRIPGTTYVLDPVQAAFNIGTLIRWLDYNDTWLAAEWGHPSDNLGAILAVADYQAQQRLLQKKEPLRMREVLTAMIKAYEIQGILALENAFNRLGLDHVILVKVASAAVASFLLGQTSEQITATLSQAWVDGQQLRTYRHAPNTGSRKSWAAGDACSRAVWLAWLTQRGEKGYPSALTAKTWGFQDSTFRGNSLKRSYPYKSYVMENILFKVAFPAEFHAQTAVEAAMRLHPQLKHRLPAITTIELNTQEAALRIIDKTGPLHNPADRDHCLQYMVAVALLYGDLKAEYYEDNFAKDPRIDALRAKLLVRENQSFSLDYLNPEKRSIANTLQVFFEDGTSTEKIAIEYPMGHPRRRTEAIPLLFEKFKENVSRSFKQNKIAELLALFSDQEKLENLPVNMFMDLLVT
jgi:2-methylcitrate dehydratase